MDNPFNAVWDAQPPAPICGKQIEISIVGRRCVYINNYRVAGGKPYVSEHLPQHEMHTTLGEILSAFTAEEIRAALAEKEARAEYFRAYHANREDHRHG